MPDAPKTPNKGGQGGQGQGGKGPGGKGPSAGGGKDANAREVRTLSLVKGQQRFCFRYELGDEPKVLDALVEMVNRRELSFDWFDAAVLSHQLGQHLAKELQGFLPKKAA